MLASSWSCMSSYLSPFPAARVKYECVSGVACTYGSYCRRIIAAEVALPAAALPDGHDAVG